ncbi:MAG: endonuclease [Euryarchaeota archaeon]|nr:endonuclease [Euryarchaeota archaeon]
MSEEYDVEDWWPSGSPFEVMVGAVLTQQTVWETVSKVLDEMRERGLMDVGALANADGDLERVIRPTGFYNQKAKHLRGMSRHILDRYEGDAMAMLMQDTDAARWELLSLGGIGKETADSILLFAGGRPKFVAASYVSRVLSRTGTFSSLAYDDVQRFVESKLPRSPGAYREFYALCVQHCKSVCRTVPGCDECPLSDHCPYPLRRAGRARSRRSRL